MALSRNQAWSRAVISPHSPPGTADGSNRVKFTSIQQVRSKAVCLRVHRHVIKEEDWLRIQIQSDWDVLCRDAEVHTAAAAPRSALSHTGTSLRSNYWRTNALELQQKDRQEFPIKNA